MVKAKLITDVNNRYFSKNKITTSTSQPTTGSYTIGDIVLSSSPSSSCYGWICTASGTPGSWMVLKNVSDWNNISGKPSTFPPTSHQHLKIWTEDTRDFSRKPNEYEIGHYSEFKTRSTCGSPYGAGTYTVVETIKGWADKSGGNSLQVAYGSDLGTLPDLSVRTGNNDAEAWGPWYKIFTESDYSVNVRPAGDYGFGCSGKPSGFIGAFPGWDKNTLYINTYSKDGLMTPAFSNVEVNTGVTRLNSDLRVQHTSYLPYIRDVNNLIFNANYGDCYIGHGNGDAASYDKHNLIIRSWYGIGFRNNNDTCTVVMDTRTGDIDTKGQLRTEQCLRIKGKYLCIQWDDPGDIGEGSIWIRS